MRTRAGKSVDGALSEQLAPDLAELATDGISRALFAHPHHHVMLRDGAEELRRRLAEVRATLLPKRLIELGVVPLMLQSIKAADRYDPPVVAAAGAVLGLAAQLSSDAPALELLTEHHAVSVLMPYMTSASPPPHALLNGAALLANALNIRDGVG